jgi:hypothetical protein
LREEDGKQKEQMKKGHQPEAGGLDNEATVF